MIKNFHTQPDKIRALLSGFRPVFYYENFDDYRAKLGFSVVEIAALIDKSPATVKRYIDRNNAPQWLYLLLYVAAGYVLDKEFFGFSFSAGKLYTSTWITRNRGFTRQEITEYAFFMDYLRTLDNEKQKCVDISHGFDPDQLHFKFL